MSFVRKYGSRVGKLISSFLFAIVFSLSLASTVQSKTKRFIIDAEIQSHILELAQPILEVAGLPKNSVKIYIIEDDTIGAFVMKGRKLFLHTGLLIKTQTPAQLLGVLAHEIAHIAAGHLIRRSQVIDDSQNVAILGMVLGALASATTQGSQAATIIAHGANQASLASLLKHSRSQESAADQAAMRYMVAAKISPKGLLEFLETLENQELLSVKRRSPYVRTHPHTADRVKFAREQSLTYSNLQTRLPKKNQSKHLRMRAKLSGFIFPATKTFQIYPPNDQSISAQYARAVGYYKKSELTKSLVILDNLLKQLPEDPYFWELKGQILLETNKKQKACAAFRKALSFSNDEPLILIQLARAELTLNTGESDRSALNHLRQAVQRLPNSAFSWHQLAIAQGRTGNKAMAKLSLAEEALLRKNKPLAIRQAEIAKKRLPKGSAAYQRAIDIIHFAAPTQRIN